MFTDETNTQKADESISQDHWYKVLAQRKNAHLCFIGRKLIKVKHSIFLQIISQ
jgi:hypothetical protein